MNIWSSARAYQSITPFKHRWLEHHSSWRLRQGLKLRELSSWSSLMESRCTIPQLMTPVNFDCFSGDLLVRLWRGLSRKASSWLPSGWLPLISSRSNHFTQDDETRWGSSQGALCGSVSQIILPRTCESKWNDPSLHMATMWTPRCPTWTQAQWWQWHGKGRVLSRLAGLVKAKNQNLNRLMSGWCLERPTQQPASLEQSEETTVYRYWQ